MDTVEQITGELEKIKQEARSAFGKLSEEQLNWKPSKDKWSIAQCLDHLIIAGKTYYPQFEEVISGKHQNSIYQNLKFISRFIGKQMVKDLGPAKTKTFKNPVILTPSQSNIPRSIVADFEKNQDELSSIILKLGKTDLQNTVIYSPVIKVIIYNLEDVLNIITGHEQRHIIQAKNVLASPRFPR